MPHQPGRTDKSSKTRTLLARLENQVRLGQSRSVRAELSALRLDRLSRLERLAVANLARRTGLSRMAISILNPVVRENEERAAGLPQERLEYAVALAVEGAVAEASALLDSVDPQKHSRSLLYRCFALFPQWRYAEAIEPLTRFLSLSTDRYSLLIAQVNLAAALIFERRTEEARKVLAAATKEARATDAALLLGNCLELGAQLSLVEGQYTRAEKMLTEAAFLHKNVYSVDSLLVRKWRAVLRLKRDGAGKSALREIAAVRDAARTTRQWETVRDCESFIAIALQDESLMTHVLHGTPFPAYREVLRRRFDPKFRMGLTYDWFPLGRRGAETLDLATGREIDGSRALSPGQLPHRLLSILASDFYRPFRPVELFSSLFPGEYFNPISSLPRVHHTIGRLRAWFRGARVPLAVVEGAGSYSLTFLSRYVLRTSLSNSASSDLTPPREALQLEILASSVGRRPFSRSEAAGLLGISERSTGRLLSWAVTRGQAETLSAGPSTRYRIR